MLVEELLIDGLAAAKPFLDAMPEPNAGFAQFPAKINFFAVKLRGEIDETDIQVLYHASELVDFFQFFP